MSEAESSEVARRRIYSHVKTWGDLLYTNLAFLTNRMWGTFYYTDRFSAEDPRHAAASSNNLIELHKLGVFTDNGQDSACDDYLQQRAYVTAYVPQTMEAALIARLHSDPRIFFRVINFTTNKAEDTVPEEFNEPFKDGSGGRSIFCVTRTLPENDCFTSLFDLQYGIKGKIEEIKHNAPTKTVYNLLVKQSVYVEVTVRAWCEQSADGILLEHVRAIHTLAL